MVVEDGLYVEGVANGVIEEHGAPASEHKDPAPAECIRHGVAVFVGVKILQRCNVTLKAPGKALNFTSLAFLAVYGQMGMVRIFLCDRVVGMGGVPEGDQIVSGFADVLAVFDVPGEDAGSVQTVLDGGIQAVLDVERAIQLEVGKVGA